MSGLIVECLYREYQARQLKRAKEEEEVCQRVEFARSCGLDVETITIDTMFILYGEKKDGYPEFVKFSMYVNPGKVIVVDSSKVMVMI